MKNSKDDIKLSIFNYLLQYIIMVPNLPAGESTIVMSWETTPPQDMDIYVAAIKNSDNSICIVNFDSRQCTDAAVKLTRFLNFVKAYSLFTISLGIMLQGVTMDLRLFCLKIQPSTASILIFWVLKIMNLKTMEIHSLQVVQHFPYKTMFMDMTFLN